MYYFSITIVIISNIFYTIFQDSIPNHLNPLVALASMYGAGMLVALIFYIKTKKHYHIGFKQNFELRIIAFGLTNIIIDFGFLSAFRANWKIGVLNIAANIIVLILLTMIGKVWFKEKLSVLNVLGIVIGAFGLTLLNM